MVIDNINSSDLSVEYDFEVELRTLIDHNVMIHVTVTEDGECWYDDTGPGHMEYTREITGFSIEYYVWKDLAQQWWYFAWNSNPTRTTIGSKIPLAIAAEVAIEVTRHFLDKTQEDMALIMHGNEG